MLPENKANELKEQFKVKCSIEDNELQIKCAKAYINQLLSDFYFMEGDYQILDYKHEWHKYESYWHAVLKCL